MSPLTRTVERSCAFPAHSKKPRYGGVFSFTNW
jgi:hypothetical protein